MSTPVVITKRLVLEKITDKHREDLYSLLSNKVVQKHFPSTLNREETNEFYDKIQNRYQSDGFCFLAVIRKEDESFLGICGLLKQNVEQSEKIEIGYRFLNHFWGNGYATEAVNGCVEYVKERKMFESLIILSVPENIPSINVAKRCGFTYVKNTLFHGLTHEMYATKI